MSEYVYRDAEPHCSTKYLLRVVRELLRGVPPQSVVVDLGCGNGSFLAQFRQHGWELHGLDMSRSGIEEASKAYSGIQFGCADLTTDLSSHPLAGKCDVVISTEVVEHVFLPRLYAKNCSSFLKPGGILIVSTPYHGYLKNLALALAGNMDFHYGALLDYGHIKFWSRPTLTSLLAEAGFEVKRFEGAGRTTFLWKSMVILAKKL
jgi:2-polyprenyl-6-hydroxyphenyl methylase/3-demethylubiquinone-9 3-methyltransferase